MRKARAVRRNRASFRDNLGFVLADPEPDNFTFEIANLADLAQWTATVAGCALDLADAHIAEPRLDQALQIWLRKATGAHRLWIKAEPPFGKRLGWYGLVRAMRPRLIIETGVHDGLGSLLLLRGLERNAEDGYPGRLVSFDVNPTAGWLVGSHPLWELRIESSHDGLPAVLSEAGEIDLFIYDGWHSYDAERWDLTIAFEHLAPGGALLSDDAQITHALADLCRDHQLAYNEFHEEPVDHFHPGAVLGAGRRSPK